MQKARMWRAFKGVGEQEVQRDTAQTHTSDPFSNRAVQKPDGL